MKAAVLYEVKTPLKIETFALPEIGHDQVLVKLVASGVCHSDWHVVKGDWPPFVCWWIPDDETPTRTEGAKRLEHLHDKGSTAYNFDFKSPFDADGQPLRVDRQKIQD